MAAIGITETGATRQALVASLVQETLKQQGILLPTVRDYSSFAAPGAKSVAVPRRDTFAAADKSENSDLTAQELTFSTDLIDLDPNAGGKHKAIYAELERVAALQANVAVQAEIVDEMAKELALQIDKDVITELKLASASAPDHRLQFANTPTDTLQAVDILEARRLMNVQNVPQGERYMVISPDQEKAMLQIANFIEVDKYGPNEAIMNAELGRIYGFRVLMHNGIAAAESVFYHASAVGYATQMQPEFETDKDLKGVKDEFLLHWVYGLKVLDSGKRQVLFNASGT